MATYFVAKTGNDSNDGLSVSAPKLTIKSAYDSVSNNDTIIILDSETYAGASNYQINTTPHSINGITIKGDDGTYSGSAQRPVIDGENTAQYFVKTRVSWVLERLEFKNFASGSTEGILGYAASSSLVTVTECIFRDSTGLSISLGLNTDTYINRCIFYNINGVASGDEGCIKWAGSNAGEVIITNCLFYNLGPKQSGFRIVFSLNNSDSIISHCTIVKRNSGIAGAVQPTYLFDIGPGTFKNNLIYNFDVSNGGATVNATVAGAANYNTWGSTDSEWSGSQGPLRLGTETGNLVISADPGFLDYTGNDYRLTPAARSIAIDAASGSTETVDITNTSRSVLDKLAFNSGINDNGCYETSFWTPTTEVTTNSTGEDFIIKTYLNANAGFNRLKVESGFTSRVVDQVPFGLGLNGVVPTSIRQRGLGNRGYNELVTAEEGNFQPSYVSSKGKTSN